MQQKTVSTLKKASLIIVNIYWYVLCAKPRMPPIAPFNRWENGGPGRLTSLTPKPRLLLYHAHAADS